MAILSACTCVSNVWKYFEIGFVACVNIFLVISLSYQYVLLMLWMVLIFGNLKILDYQAGCHHLTPCLFWISYLKFPTIQLIITSAINSYHGISLLIDESECLCFLRRPSDYTHNGSLIIIKKIIICYSYRLIQTTKDTYKYSFFPRTIVQWDLLPAAGPMSRGGGGFSTMHYTR